MIMRDWTVMIMMMMKTCGLRAVLIKKSVREVARAAGKYFIYGNHNMLAFILASLWYLS